MSGEPQVLSIRESNEEREKLEEVVLRMLVSRLKGIEGELIQIADTLSLLGYRSSSESLAKALKYIEEVREYLDDYADILTLT